MDVNFNRNQTTFGMIKSNHAASTLMREIAARTEHKAIKIIDLFESEKSNPVDINLSIQNSKRRKLLADITYKNNTNFEVNFGTYKQKPLESILHFLKRVSKKAQEVKDTAC